MLGLSGQTKNLGIRDVPPTSVYSTFSSLYIKPCVSNLHSGICFIHWNKERHYETPRLDSLKGERDTLPAFGLNSRIEYLACQRVDVQFNLATKSANKAGGRMLDNSFCLTCFDLRLDSEGF